MKVIIMIQLLYHQCQVYNQAIKIAFLTSFLSRWRLRKGMAKGEEGHRKRRELPA